MSDRCNTALMNGTAMMAMPIAALWATGAVAQVTPPPPASTEISPQSASPTADPAAPDTQATEQDPGTSAPSGSDIVVTGSRLDGASFRAPTPVTVVGPAEIGRQAPSAIADVVNRIPSFRQTTGTNQGQRTSENRGANQLDLRGLGPSRTLLLIDGRRQATSDTNIIPVSLVDRVEVVTGGASAAYGSDAVAGVANFILRNKLEGVDVSLSSGFSSHGDNNEVTLNLAAGTSFAGGRGHVIFGADFTDNKGVGIIYSRDWGRRQAALVAFGSPRAANIPAQGFLEDVTFSTRTLGGVITSGPLRNTAFGPGGVPYTFVQGTVYGTVMTGPTNPDSVNSLGHFNLKIPLRRISTLARVSYEFSDNIEGFVEGGYNNVYSLSNGAYAQLPALIALRSNPFLPAATAAAMDTAGVTSINIGRSFGDLDGYRLNAERNTYRASAGFNGRIGDGIKWSVYYQYGKSSEQREQRTNFVNALYLQAAYVVSTPAGPACGPTATNPMLNATTRAEIAAFQQINPGAVCAPLNIFGNGSLSAEAAKYITGGGITHDIRVSNTLQVLAGDIRFSPLSTWAGAINVATGIEHRKEQLDATADPIGFANLWSTTNGSKYSGGQTVTEGFAEIGVPLAADASFAKSLDLNGAVRYTDYSLSGTVTTWKAGLTYQPVDSLRLRVTRSRDIRAPNLTELFSAGLSAIVQSVNNPINGQTGAVNTIVTGNRDLRPEIADTWTGGVILTPTFFRGFRASVDYFDIKVDRVIASVALTDVLSRCARGQQDFCNAITFNSTAFGIASVRLQPFNLNQLKTNGVDLEVSYHTDLDGVGVPGALDLRALATRVIALKVTDASGTIDRVGSAQNGGVPKWTSIVDLTYSNGGFSSTVTGRYFSPILFDATLVGPDNPAYNPAASNSILDNTLPGRFYLDTSISYRFGGDDDRKYEFFALVNNLLDKDPPVEALQLTSAATQSGNPYDFIGRTFKVGARLSF